MSSRPSPLALAAMPNDSREPRLRIPSWPKLTLALLCVVVSASGGLPAAANATVAFNTNSFDPEVWVSANDDGSEATYVGHGLVTQISPDGKLLAYEHGTARGSWELVIYNVATGRRSVRLTRMHSVGENILGETTAFAWSPDSTTVAVLQNERGSSKQALYVIGAQGSDAKTRIATGHFRGVSFSPDGSEVVFGLAQTEGPLPKTDIARAPSTGGSLTSITQDHISGWPLWGPGGQIALSKRSKAKRWKWRGEVWTSAAFDLFVMNRNGGRVKRLTKVGYEAGVFPAFWSPSGEQLVANFESLEKNYAALVTPATATVKPLNPPVSGSGLAGYRAGFAATTLSADGQTVLGCQGTLVDAAQTMATVPLTGGKPTVLDQEAWSPSWSGLRTAGVSAC
jgi:dipeptidyl aminopeptidase/acylaminoacyl peptidase